MNPQLMNYIPYVLQGMLLIIYVLGAFFFLLLYPKMTPKYRDVIIERTTAGYILVYMAVNMFWWIVYSSFIPNLNLLYVTTAITVVAYLMLLLKLRKTPVAYYHLEMSIVAMIVGCNALIAYLDLPIITIAYYMTLIGLTLWSTYQLINLHFIKPLKDEEKETQEMADQLMLDSDLDECHGKEADDDEKKSKVPRQKREFSDEEIDIFARRLKKVCEENLFFTNEELTRNELISAMGTNRTYFSICLKEATGLTFNEYINELRINYALKLMRNPHINLDAIAFECGYKHKSSYYRAFYARFGCTPSDYLSQQRKK